MASRAGVSRGRALPVEPLARPAAPAETAARIDSLLDGLLSAPVTLEDMYQVAAAVRDVWPGCKAEVYHLADNRTVRVNAWLGDYYTGQIIRRTVVAS